ncbi:YheC/YheD family protein [Marinicrinis lubricantis]|uniref:YheC/YheD family protein n=1 Tax=Marinicrinis lubricantis TaxID=2086470 RepID=A0ABW1IHE9_9BACL
MNKTAWIGILVAENPAVHRIPERSYYEQLSLAAASEKVAIYVFSPDQVNWSSKVVQGVTYTVSTKKWNETRCPIPHFIYDRSFFTNKAQLTKYHQFIRTYEQNRSGRILNHRLGSKWHVWNTLMRKTELHCALPATMLIRSTQDVLDWFTNNDQAFIKPNAGTHGIGTAYIRKDGKNRFHIIGRNLKNEKYTLDCPDLHTFNGWLKTTLRERNYLLQPYLQLCGQQGQPFDIRVLMQKNEKGEWTLTGKAVRSGTSGTMTSNLHGGGTAADARHFLSQIYPHRAAREIQQQIDDLAFIVCSCIEQNYGRMLELGIDFGVEPSGKVWLIEINSKPGRNAFRQAGLPYAERQAILNPIRYIRYLFEQSIGG